MAKWPTAAKAIMRFGVRAPVHVMLCNDSDYLRESLGARFRSVVEHSALAKCFMLQIHQK